MFWMEALKQNSAGVVGGGAMTGEPFFKQMFWRSQHRIEFVLHSIPAPPPNLHGADGTFFTIHALLVFSLSAIPCLETSLARSSPSPSLFVLSGKKKKKVLVFQWSRRCFAASFDVRRGDGSESSPVSFHGSPKVDFEPVSVKLGLIATTGGTRFTHTHTRRLKNDASVPWIDRLSWRNRQFDVAEKAIRLRFHFFLLFFFPSRWHKRCVR